MIKVRCSSTVNQLQSLNVDTSTNVKSSVVLRIKTSLFIICKNNVLSFPWINKTYMDCLYHFV